MPPGSSSTRTTATWRSRLCVAAARTLPPKICSGEQRRETHAAETYVSYCGRYEYRGDSVIHYVELSLFPNWSGVEQERLIEVAGDRLTLSTRPMLFQGLQQSAHLVWERA